MTSTNGCINGASYDFDSELVCGRSYDSQPPIYSKSIYGCCNNGYPFMRDVEFCCGNDYNKVYPIESGTCEAWSNNDDQAYGDCWDCTDLPPARTLFLEEVIDPNLSVQGNLDVQPIVDTISNGPSSNPCNSTDSTYGCYNTYSYLLSSQYPCDNYLLSYSTYGCCDGKPFRFSSQSCCFINDKYVVKNAFQYCKCMSYKCTPTSTPTKIRKTKSPTSFPSSSIPSISFTPTESPTHRPTHLPTISQEPTQYHVLSKNNDSNEKNNRQVLIIGVSVAAFVMIALAIFQSRASKLIKNRHSDITNYENKI